MSHSSKSQISGSTKNNIAHVNKQLQENMNHLLEDLQRSQNLNHQLTMRIKELEQSSLLKTNILPNKVDESQILEQTRKQGNLFDFELHTKDEEIRSLKQQLELRTKELAEARVIASVEYERCKEYKQQIQAHYSQIESLQKQLSQARNTSDKVALEQFDTEAFKIELEHLRSDYQRVLEMLRTTKEYREYAEKQMSENGRERYLFKLEQTHKKLSEQNPLLVVPQKAHSYALNFRAQWAKAGHHLPEDVIEDLLFELNKAWSEKLESDIQVIKQQFKRKISMVERKATTSENLDVAEAKQTIERLRADIMRLEQENRDLYGKRPSRNIEPSMEKTIKESRRQSQQQKKEKEKILSLETTVREKTLQLNNRTHDKLMYYDGALWAARQIKSQIDQTGNQDLKRFVQEFEKQAKTAQSNI